MRALLALFLLQHAARVAGAVSTGGSGSYGSYVSYSHECRHESMADIMANQSLTPIDMFKRCNQYCPMLGDVRPECDTHHAFHSFYSTFTEAQDKRPQMQWTVMCIASILILGALFRMLFPSWIPYTVGVLFIFMILGVAAGINISDVKCPMYAFQYRDAGSSYVTRANWNEFLCVGCHPQSYCLSRAHPLYDGRAARTCGDGSHENATQPVAGCKHTFDGLNVKWRHTDMLAEHIGYKNANGEYTADDYLTADQLWTPECNLFRDIISLADIDPHALLVIFLPALLFESACFGIDFGIFRKQIFQILVMAFPAMVVASLISAAMLYALTPSILPGGGWDFTTCWLAGVINSATDPVAVVALLKELGASKTLGTLIEGESLLNDGSAVVLYVFVKNLIGYDHKTIPPPWMREDNRQVGVEFVRIVGQMALFGVFLGLAAGWLSRQLLRFVYADKLVETSILVGISYLTFWVGELATGASAVLAVVVLGLYMNYHKSCLSPSVIHFMHEFYEAVAHGLNTLIFAIAGMKMGTILADTSLQSVGTSFALGLAGVFACLVARAAALVLHFPILRKLGTGCKWQEAVVMWWGGLRGSVGLALALVVQHASYDGVMWPAPSASAPPQSLPCRDWPNGILVVTVFVIAFTVGVNGISMSHLMLRLRLLDLTDERCFMVNRAHDKLEEETQAYIEEQKKKRPVIFRDIDWDYVNEKRLNQSHWEPLKVADEGKAAWLEVLNIERSSYLVQFEAGVLGSEAYGLLETFMADLVAEAQRPSSSSESQSGQTTRRLPSGQAAAVLSNKYASRKQKAFDVYEAAFRATNEDIAKSSLKRIQTQRIETDPRAGGEDHPHDSAGGGDAAAGKAPDAVRRMSSTTSKRSEELSDLYDWKFYEMLERLVKKKRTEQLRIAYEFGLAYLEALHEVKHATKHLDIFAMVAYEHQDNRDEMIKVMEQIQQRLPGLIRDFKTGYVTSLVLHRQQAIIDHLMHEGQLIDLDVGPMKRAAAEHLKHLYLKPLVDGFKNLWRKMPKHYTKHAETSLVVVGKGTAALSSSLGKACSVSRAIASMPARAVSGKGFVVTPAASDDAKGAGTGTSPPASGDNRPVRPQYKRSNTRKLAAQSRLMGKAERAVLATTILAPAHKSTKECSGVACDGGTSTAGSAPVSFSTVEPVSPATKGA